MPLIGIFAFIWLCYHEIREDNIGFPLLALLASNARVYTLAACLGDAPNPEMTGTLFASLSFLSRVASAVPTVGAL